MGYINEFQLIHKVLQGKPLNTKQLLSDIDRQAVIRDLQKSKDGVPRPFKYTDEPIEEPNLAKMPKSDKKQLFNLYSSIQMSPETVLPKLIAFKKPVSPDTLYI
ncbi:MAG: hypothetical protein B6D64_09145 [Bacteroidetes bacterium 4484_276]|nr:MAG: hypothetical protein B6D64_09145 [Bacteroidetes bacterium 4484_276]